MSRLLPEEFENALSVLTQCMTDSVQLEEVYNQWFDLQHETIREQAEKIKTLEAKMEKMSMIQAPVRIRDAFGTRRRQA